MHSFSFLKKITYILILNLVIFPAFFLQTKLTHAQAKEEDTTPSNPFSYARSKLLTLINKTGTAVSFISSSLTHLPHLAYNKATTLFVDVANIQGTTSIASAQTPSQLPLYTTQSAPLSNAITTTPILEEELDLSDPANSRFLLTLLYVESRFNQLKAEIAGSKATGTVSSSRSSSSGGGVGINTVTNLKEDLQGQIDLLASTTIGDISGFTTTDLAEGTNLYFTDLRAITALTGQNISIFNNDANYLTTTTLNSLVPIEVGNGNSVTGINSSGFGYQNTVPGDYSAAFGYNNIVSGYGSTASGVFNESSGSSASALGISNIASAQFSSAVGFANTASGYRSSALGYQNTASTTSSSALGYSNTASQTNSSAVGFANTASGNYSSAIGTFNVASGLRSSASGYSNTASATGSSASGYDNTASQTNSSAFGYRNTASTLNSQVFGRSNFTGTGDAHVGVGILNNQTGGSINTSTGAITGTPVAANSGDLSIAVGIRNLTAGALSTAAGYLNIASGSSSSALGFNNTSSGNYGSSAIGYTNIASGQYSSAFGHLNISSGYRSSAFGRVNTASGQYSSVFGWGNTASQTNSSAFGSNINNSTADSLELGPSNTAKLQLTATYFRPFADNTQSLGGSSNKWTEVHATNGTIQTSDERLKKNIEELSYGLEEILQLRPVSYDWKDDSNRVKQLGLIAQEVLQVMPEVVNIGDDVDQTLGINYASIVPSLISAIQDLAERTDWMGEYITRTADGIVGRFKRVQTEELCVDENTCLDKETLRQFIEEYNQSNGVHSNDTSNSSPDVNLVDDVTITDNSTQSDSDSNPTDADTSSVPVVEESTQDLVDTEQTPVEEPAAEEPVSEPVAEESAPTV